MAQYPVTLADGLKVRSKTALFKGSSLVAPPARLSLRSVLAYRFRPGAVIADHMTLRSKVATTTTFHVTIRERTMRIKGIFSVGIVAHLMSRVTLHASTKATPLVAVRERVALAQRQQVAHTFALAMRSALKLHDGTRVGIGATIRQGLSISSRLDRLYRALATVTTNVTIRQSQGVQLRFVLLHADTVTVSERDIERMVYAGELGDSLALVAGFYDPGEDITTWAINARTGAVTEYTGYGFSSFAKFGPGYVATTPKGLYELAGDTDAGQPIISDMISGLLEMTGSNLTSIKAVYLAVRGKGEMFLRLTADEGRNTTYRVLTRSLHTARIDVGKGWRARYFSYQLVSTGQDFDLQGLEFLPVASVRRV